MKVFVTGGTGAVGFPVVCNLHKHGYSVRALSRSAKSETKLKEVGVSVIAGDLENHQDWLPVLDDCEAIVHMALGFTPEDDKIEQNFLSSLMASRSGKTPLIFVQTGGCWMYGNTGNRLANEGDPFDSSGAWSWWMKNTEMLLSSDHLDTRIVHPAMVWSRSGSCFGMMDDIKKGNPVRVHENADHRWTLVNDEDLADLYRLVLEKGKKREHYNGAGEEGVCIGQLARKLCKAHEHHSWLDVVAIADTIREQGAWAEGYGLDQQMSSAKARQELGWKPQHSNIFAAFSG